MLFRSLVPCSTSKIAANLAKALILKNTSCCLFPYKATNLPYSASNLCIACSKKFVKDISVGKNPNPIVCLA